MASRQNNKYRSMILTGLLNRYEDSEWFRTGHGTRRVFLPDRIMADLQEHMEQPDEKADILETLKSLSNQELLYYSWEKYEEGNLLAKIWLNTDEKLIRESYRLAGMPDGREAQSVLLKQLENAISLLEHVTPDHGTVTGHAARSVTEFLKAQAEWIRTKKKVPRFFTGKKAADQKLLNCICFLGQNSSEVTERVLSTRLYGDSKVFEKTVRLRLLTCLRVIQKAEGGIKLRDEELLQLYGVVRWPEVMEFCGDISVTLDNGDCISFRSSRYGAYINSDTISHISKVHFGTVKQVLFIENKANYVWYVQQKQREDELVIFHGGFYSPAKGKWFGLLYDAGTKAQGMRIDADPRQDGSIRWLHWSDIDIGGFRIFQTLRDHIVPELAPYRMDTDTLRKAHLEGKCMPMQKDAYRKTLEDMAGEPAFAAFAEVIRYMLQHNVRLEQEQLI